MHDTHKTPPAIAIARYCLERKGISKTAKLSFSKLRNIAGNSRPLFHLTHPANYPGLISSGGTIMSPVEAAVRGHARVFATHAPKGKVTAPPISIKGDRATISRRALEFMNRKSPNAMIGIDAPDSFVPNNAINSALKKYTKSHNPQHIYVSPYAPKARFGNAGIMSGTSRAKGTVVRHGIQDVILPDIVHSNGKFVEARLPQLPGSIVYDPRKVDLATAKQFKASGGIAMNARFNRLLKAYNRTIQG